jgi:integrase
VARKLTRNGKTLYEDVVYLDDPDTGLRTIRKYVYGRTRTACAKAKQDAIDERDADQGPASVDPDMTLAELYALVKQRHVKRLRPKSQSVWHAAAVKRMAREVQFPANVGFGPKPVRRRLFDVPVGELTTEMVDAWMSALQDETRIVVRNGERVEERVHGDRSINLARGCLVTTLNKGKKWRKVGERNVAEHADRFREDTRTPYVYTPEQIGEIGVGIYRRHMDGVGKRGYNRAAVLEFRAARDMSIVLLLAFAGLRISEAFALRWMDVQKNGMLRVEHSLDWSEPGYLGPVKTGESRLVPLLPEALMALERLREVMPHQRSHDFILSSERTDASTPMNRDGWRAKNFNVGAALAGYPEARPHFMRHTFISLMRRHGFSSSEVAEFVGDTEAVVDRVYTHSYKDDIRERLAAVSAALWSS